jgi:hypothetical protein
VIAETPNSQKSRLPTVETQKNFLEMLNPIYQLS